MKKLLEALALVGTLMCQLPAPVHAQAVQTAAAAPSGEEIAVSSVDHPGSDVKWGRASAVIAAPLEKVLALVEDYANYHQILPNFKKSRVLSQRGSEALVYFEVSIAMDTITFWTEMRIGPWQHEGETHTLQAKMRKGNVDAMEARWELTAVDAEHTKVVLQIFLVPKIPLPSGMISGENAKAAKKAVRTIRRRLDGRVASST